MKKLLSVSIAAAVMAMGTQSALAEEPAAATTLGSVLEASGITATGYIAAGYYNFDTEFFGQTASYNAFQANPNSFDLQQAAITIAKQPKEGFGGVVNLTAGSNAAPISSVGTTADDFDVTQAYVQYTTGGLTVIAGKFVTLMGAEVISPTGNTNVSRSISFYNAIAYTHTGVRATYAFTDTFALTAGVNNGWDQQSDMTKNKTVELGIAWNPVSMFSLLAQAYSGGEVNALGDVTDRNIIDVVATVRPTDKLTFVVNANAAEQKETLTTLTTKLDDASWSSIAAYANYQFTDQWRTSVRLESFDDQDNYKLAINPALLPPGDILKAGEGEKINEVTLTVGYMPSTNFELRAEVRRDKADNQMYNKASALYPDPSDTVNFVALEGLYKF